MAGYTYASYVTALQTMVVSQAPDVPFNTILPSCIDYAEQRIYRELNLLQTVQRLYDTILTSGNRNAELDHSFVVVNSINVLTPAGSGSSSGRRNALVPASVEMVNYLWPGDDVGGVPQIFAMIDQWNLILGPTPDEGYTIEVTGTYRPDPLSSANTVTFISERLPDLFLAASMIFMSGYMRNFGAQASDPQQGMSWEQQYDLLKASADSEELRKHFWASSWSAQPVSPQAQPQRG